MFSTRRTTKWRTTEASRANCSRAGSAGAVPVHKTAISRPSATSCRVWDNCQTLICFFRTNRPCALTKAPKPASFSSPSCLPPCSLWIRDRSTLHESECPWIFTTLIIANAAPLTGSSATRASVGDLLKPRVVLQGFHRLLCSSQFRSQTRTPKSGL